MSIRVERAAAREAEAHGVRELLGRRWSPVAFSERPVEPERVRGVLEAARWAPSSFNEQPWSFLVATKTDDPAGHRRMLGCLSEGNRRWARRAPVLMVSVARLRFSRNGKENRHAFHDVGLATENLVLQATALGLCAHMMAGFDEERVRALCGIPEGHEPVAVIALGYAGDPDGLPDGLRGRELRPRARKPLGKFVYAGCFGRSAFPE